MDTTTRTSPAGQPRETTTLSGLGLEEEWLLDTLRSGMAEAFNITEAFPKAARGTTLWYHIVASLRTKLVGEGWTMSDPNNSPRVTSPDGRTQLMIASGDSLTGKDTSAQPGFSRQRGPATATSINTNDRVFGLSVVQPELDLGLPAPRTLAWVLLYWYSVRERTLYSELSLPTGIRDGQVTNWSYRIPLSPLEFTPPPLEEGSTPLTDVDFELRRHA